MASEVRKKHGTLIQQRVSSLMSTFCSSGGHRRGSLTLNVSSQHVCPCFIVLFCEILSILHMTCYYAIYPPDGTITLLQFSFAVSENRKYSLLNLRFLVLGSFSSLLCVYLNEGINEPWHLLSSQHSQFPL